MDVPGDVEPEREPQDLAGSEPVEDLRARIALMQPEQLTQHVAQRPIRDAPPVGEATAGEASRRGRLRRKPGYELARQPRLSHAGITHDGDKARPGIAADPAIVRTHRVELYSAPDERRGAGAPPRTSEAGGSSGALAHEHLSASTAAEQCNRGAQWRATHPGAVDDDLAGLDGDPQRDHPTELCCQRSRDTQRALGVILLRGGRTEHRKNPAAGEHVDRSAGRLDLDAGDFAQASLPSPRPLEVIVRDHIGKQDRHHLALVVRVRGRGIGRCRAAKLERGVLNEYLVLEPLQTPAGLDPEPLDPHAACLAVSGKRLRLAPRPVQGQHQVLTEPLPQRLLAHERLEFPDELVVPAELELGLDPSLQRRPAQLLKTSHLAD